MNNLKYWLAFSQINRLGAKKFQLLQNYFPNLEYAWQASVSELIEAGLEQGLAEEIELRRKKMDLDNELDKINRENIKVVTIEDENYPKLLKQTYSPPFLLYYKGNLDNLHDQALAVVGTRKVSTYGQTITPQIVSELANQGLIIVSGLALGVDAIAHTTCVNNNKVTVAVLGSGLDKENIYPTTNRALANSIIENNGLIISEFPIGMMPLRHNFPARNRIISGLSLGTLVVEAGETSGALITAKFALEQNREVFAVPGQIHHPLSVGTNNLIKRGAKLVQSASDIFEELNLQEIKQQKKVQAIIPDSPEEATILNVLKNEPLHTNDIIKKTAMSAQKVNSTLMLLEMKGQIKNLGNSNYLISS